MKVVFAHDHIFYKYNNRYYSTGGLSKEMLERYTSVFDEVVIISRQKDIKEIDDNLTLASTERVKFVRIPNFKSVKKVHKRFKANKEIKNTIEDCDALIARLPSSIGSIAISHAKRKNMPFLVEVVACTWDSLWNYNVIGKLMAPYAYLVTKNQVKSSKYALYVTNSFLQKRYPTRGKTISCSNVSLTDFDEKILVKRIKKIKMKKENDKIIIGTTAAVDVKYKGQQYVIEALGELKSRGYTNLEYQLVGFGDQTYLKSMAEKFNVMDQVKFLGSLKHEKVFDWLESIDIYTQPSRQEGLPRALIEAMSRGLPAFGANTAGIPELLEKEFIFSNTKENVQEICEILFKFDKKKMVKQAKVNFTESKEYDKDIINKRRRNFFEEFAAVNK